MGDGLTLFSNHSCKPQIFHPCLTPLPNLSPSCNFMHYFVTVSLYPPSSPLNIKVKEGMKRKRWCTLNGLDENWDNKEIALIYYKKVHNYLPSSFLKFCWWNIPLFILHYLTFLLNSHCHLTRLFYVLPCSSHLHQNTCCLLMEDAIILSSKVLSFTERLRSPFTLF